MSISAEQIKQLIQAKLLDAEVFIEGDGDHFQAIIVSAEFVDKTMVQQHQLVYQSLGDTMGTAIHALSFKTITPDKWESQKKLQGIQS